MALFSPPGDIPLTGIMPFWTWRWKFNEARSMPPASPYTGTPCPIPHSFTLQCCFGHFVYDGEPDRENLILPSSDRGTVENVLYRLAYLTVCLQDNPGGREMYADQEALTSLNPDYIQFGSADWFWGSR